MEEYMWKNQRRMDNVNWWLMSSVNTIKNKFSDYA